jgi:hypothetical protein
MKLPLPQVFSRVVYYHLFFSVPVVFMFVTIRTTRVFFTRVLSDVSLKDPVIALSSQGFGSWFRTLFSETRIISLRQDSR